MTTSANKIDVAIIGGGILGLWCAYMVLKKYPGLLVVVFESENYLGEHTSGRNSEVLHSGLYYETNSLKHLRCLEGNKLWRDYIKLKQLPFLDCGKVVVSNVDQLEKLDNLFKRGVKNQIPGLRKLSTSEIESLQENVHISDGFYISSSGVLNVSESLKSLRHDIEAMGGVVLIKNKVIPVAASAQSFVLEVNNDFIEAKNLINAAGLFAVDFRKKLGLKGFENYYVKGSYLKLRKKLDLHQLIYPLPPVNGLGLGVHLTLDTAGEQKFGPDIEEVDTINYSTDDSTKARMIPSIHEIFKNINDADLQLGYSGIRPKIKKDGLLYTDFVFNTHDEHGLKGYFEFLGIESPGVTAAPSLAKNICDVLNV